MAAAGIDPSTKTSVCTIHAFDDIALDRVQFPIVDDRGVAARLLRVTLPILHWSRNAPRITTACVEGYSHGSNHAGKSLSIEIGYEWRRALTSMDSHPRVYEVPPTQVKKWATGKGAGDKVAVASALARRYDREFLDDNDADAFALAMIAAQIEGICTPETQYQRDVIDAIMNPVEKPKRKRKGVT